MCHFFHVKSLKYHVHFIYTEPLASDKIHFKNAVATPGSGYSIDSTSPEPLFFFTSSCKELVGTRVTE